MGSHSCLVMASSVFLKKVSVDGSGVSGNPGVVSNNESYIRRK